jgi:hypothetical protein
LRAFHEEPIHVTRNLIVPSTITASRLLCTVGSASYLAAWDKRFVPARLQPTDFHHLISILNNLRKNNYLYIQLKAVENGAMISGQELPNLPPTIMTILSEKYTTGTHSRIRESLLDEQAIPLEYGVFGGKAVQMRVKR